jgi:DNA-binding MurR/RpiR family transcriptional regulator
MSHAEITEKYNCKDHSDLSRTYRNNSEEPLEKFVERVEKAYENLEKKYA